MHTQRSCVRGTNTCALVCPSLDTHVAKRCPPSLPVIRSQRRRAHVLPHRQDMPIRARAQTTEAAAHIPDGTQQDRTRSTTARQAWMDYRIIDRICPLKNKYFYNYFIEQHMIAFLPPSGRVSFIRLSISGGNRFDRTNGLSSVAAWGYGELSPRTLENVSKILVEKNR